MNYLETWFTLRAEIESVETATRLAKMELHGCPDEPSDWGNFELHLLQVEHSARRARETILEYVGNDKEVTL